MTGYELLSAMGRIDEAYIAEAEGKPIRKPSPIRWLSAAACLCILLLAAFHWQNLFSSKSSDCTASNGSMESAMADGAMNDAVIVTEAGAELPSLTLRIDAWEEDRFTATVTGTADTGIFPVGTALTVYFGPETAPTSGEFPAGSIVTVRFTSFEQSESPSITIESIRFADGSAQEEVTP